MFSAVLIVIAGLILFSIIKKFIDAPVLKEWEDIEYEDKVRRKAI
jgi:hypothetical protein